MAQTATAPSVPGFAAAPWSVLRDVVFPIHRLTSRLTDNSVTASDKEAVSRPSLRIKLLASLASTNQIPRMLGIVYR